ncbi:uncharacterized protein [Pagrus major]|uniref:uncharacterized protein n=1 Tax=Pagrus major TaxID=143350 RepID=UPI003CC878D8
MANETTLQTSCVQDIHEDDECRENIPTGVTAIAGTSKLEVQVGDVVGYSSTQPGGENEPLSDTCTFSTPGPTSGNGGVKAMSRLSGLRSALTPIVKYLNIGNRCASPEPLKRGNNPHLTAPPFSPGNTAANYQKSTGSSSQYPNFSSSHSGRSLGDSNAPACWLADECLPEITLLDVTCDSTMQMTKNDSALPDSVPSTPVTGGSVKSSLALPQPPRLSASTNTTAQIPCPQNKTPELVDAPLRWLDDRFFPEITLLDVTHDSEFSPRGEVSSLEVTNDISSVDSLENNTPSSALGGQIPAESGTLEITPSEDLSSTLDGNVTHTVSSISEQSDKCENENTPKASLEVTRDISMDSVSEDSQPSSEPSGQNMAKTQTAEDTLGTHPANVTHDVSSSSDMSDQCAVSEVSASDMQCNISSKNGTFELDGEEVVNSDTIEANNEEPLKSHDNVPQPSPKTAGSGNGTFTVAEQSNLSASTSVNTYAQIPQNKTLDLPPSNVNSPTVESEAQDPSASASKNTTETSSVINPNSSAVKASGTCDVQNVTFDRHSLHKSSGNSTLGEAGAATFSLQSNTFDTKSPSQQNGTITVSETSSSDSHQNTLDRPSPPKVCNATSSPKHNSEVHNPELSKHNGTTESTEPNAKMVDTPESTFEVNPVVEAVPGADRCEAKDHSQSGLPAQLGLSDTLGHQSMDMEQDNKANTLNLDDTLDLRADSLITSTPMTNCKMVNFHFEREDGKIIGAQKKLYGDGPRKPNGQLPSDVPSNIICDRKTFLTQPAAKSLRPPLKAASQLLKYKPASLLPGRFEPMTSGLPMTRQRTQAEALRNTAASEAPHVTTGISAPYNLRATATGSKQPNPGLQKPRCSAIPSGIQRAAPGLRPPSARSNAQASLSTDKLCGPTATNSATKMSQAKRHPLTRGEALPTAKRKKMDAPLPSASAETSASSCDAANKAKNLKPPTTGQRALPAKTQRDGAAVPACTAETSASCNAVSRARSLKQPLTSHKALLPKPQGHGCAKCAVLEQQLEMKSEEIKTLKEELLKYRKPQDEC